MQISPLFYKNASYLLTQRLIFIRSWQPLFSTTLSSNRQVYSNSPLTHTHKRTPVPRASAQAKALVGGKFAWQWMLTNYHMKKENSNSRNSGQNRGGVVVAVASLGGSFGIL